MQDNKRWPVLFPMAAGVALAETLDYFHVFTDRLENGDWVGAILWVGALAAFVVPPLAIFFGNCVIVEKGHVRENERYLEELQRWISEHRSSQSGSERA